MFDRFKTWGPHQVRWAISGLAVVIVLGVFDWLTGPDLSFSLFYLAPICLVTWFASRKIGVVMSLASVIVWVSADFLMDLSHLVILWNSAVRLLTFLVIVFLLASLRDLKRGLEDKVKEQVSALTAEVEVRKRAQEVLWESENRYRSVVEHAGTVIICLTPTMEIMEWNRSAECILGWKRDEVFGKSYPKMCLLPEVQPVVAQHVATVLEGKASDGFEYSVRTRDGKMRCMIWNATRVVGVDGVAYAMIAVGQDITERRQTEQQLSHYQERLRSLSSEASLAEERERRRLATDLHDGLSQLLNLANMKIATLKSSLPVDHRQQLRDLGDLIEQAEQSARSLTFQLSPPALYDLGFVAAVEWLVDDMRQRYNMEVVLEDDGQIKPMDEPVRVILYRSVREVLINVAKHAKVDTVRLSLVREGQIARVVIEDDGVGFSPSVASQSNSRGFGLFSIQERLGQIHGRMELTSVSGEGTSVVLEVPLSNQKQNREGNHREYQGTVGG